MSDREALQRQARLAALLDGTACSQVSLGVTDALILDFGDLEPNQDGQLAGSLILVVESPWRIDTPDLPVVGWDDDEEDIAHLVTALIGATAGGVEVRRPGFDLSIEFSNEHRLRVFPDCRAYFDEEMSGGALPWQLGGRGLPPTESLMGTD